MKTTKDNWIEVAKGWVLLSKNSPDENVTWYLDGLNVRENVIKDKGYWSVREDYREIIGSTFPLEGIPLIVLEDEVRKLSLEVFPLSVITGQDNNSYERALWEHAYKTVKETYKYTEEDLRNAFKTGCRNSDKSSDEFVESIHRQLEFETVEEVDLIVGNDRYVSEKLKVVPHPTHPAGQLVLKKQII